MSWLERFLNLFRGEALGRALNEELEFHLDSRIRDNIAAGMSPQEVARDARRRFGNRTLAKERTRLRFTATGQLAPTASGRNYPFVR